MSSNKSEDYVESIMKKAVMCNIVGVKFWCVKKCKKLRKHYF